MQTTTKLETVGNGKVSKVERYGWKVFDKPGRVQMIPKGQLLVDHQYQRDLNELRVQKIARDWSWIAFAAIPVARRDDMFFVIDGQHRVEAAKRRSDISDLPCVVFDVSDSVVEARGFLKINRDRRSLYTIETFRALLKSDDPNAQHVAALIKASNRTMSKESGARTVGCIGRLMFWSTNHKEKLDALWPVVTEICVGNSLHSRILDGIMYLETHAKEDCSLTHKKWRDRVLKVGYDNMIDSIARACAYFKKASTTVCAQGVVDAINKGLRGDKFNFSA